MEIINDTAAPKKERVPFLDEVRSFAIICMVFYHAGYDLVAIFDVDIPFLFSGWMNVVRDVFVAMFVFISGTACRFSSSNLKRGFKLLGIALAITLVTYIFMPSQLIIFGILHMLSICMIVYGLLEKTSILDRLHPVVGIIIAGIFFFLTCRVVGGYVGIPHLLEWQIPPSWYETSFLFPFGLLPSGFHSSDYFSLLPWFFMFMAGSYFGVYAVNRKLPNFFYKTHVKFLASIKHTLWIYVLHQPVLMAIFTLLFKLIGE